jgi:hypothetical protein
LILPISSSQVARGVSHLAVLRILYIF